MWLTNSSIGKKVLMSVTGIALILFLTFHACMNVVALISEEGYNAICEFLGANWYAVAATAVLAALVVIHFVYAIIVALGLLLHLYNFWYNMMFAELVGDELSALYAADGIYHIKQTFACPVYSIIYIIWLVALWFHLSHGFWSAFQTLGVNGKIWFNRWKTIGNVWVTIVTLMFIAVVVWFALCPACVR